MLQPTGSQGVRHDLVTEVQQHSFIKGFPGGSVVKNPSAKAGDMGSIPGARRSPREGNGNPFQDPLEKSHQRSLVGYIVHGVTKESNTT